MNNIYKQLTNVDIEEQKVLWDERGKGYYGEFLVFNKLYREIYGNCKILMNLNIPTGKGNKTTEIDLLLIHETGIYVIEVKHYKGTIYGNDDGLIWTQYFRTVKNETFKNPMLQNDYHIKALTNIYKDVPIKSIIVFANHECDLRVTNKNPNVVLCKLFELKDVLNREFNKSNYLYTVNDIDDMFIELSKYSQMQEPVEINGEKKSFSSWLEPSIINLKEEKTKLFLQTEESKRNNKKLITITIIFLVLVFICFCLLTFTIKENYDRDLNKFKQNFLHIDEINNSYITMLNDYFSVSNVSLNGLSSNAVTFNASISTHNTVYGMALTENSKYIVMTSDNKAYEYNVFGPHLTYNRYYNMIGNNIRTSSDLKEAIFHGVSKENINYIKLTNLELYKLDTFKTKVKDGLELELYKK